MFRLMTKARTCHLFSLQFHKEAYLGPVLFNLYVSELPNCTNSESVQYADDTTIYRSSKKHNIAANIKAMEADIESLSLWSNDNGLIFNKEKLVSIAFSKSRSSATSDRCFLIRSDKKSIKQETSVKLLGVIFDQHLTWNEQVNKVTKSAYAVLQTLKRFRRFTPAKTRKTLAEALVLSKLNYCNIVFSQLPKYQLDRLQRVQTCAAGYVLSRYAKLTLNWLPIRECIDWNLTKYAYRSMTSGNWPSYLRTETVEIFRDLRSNDDGPKLKFSSEKLSF